jgi:L-ascorbate 6-phosphate lactonase
MHPFEDLVVPESSVGIHWFGQNSYALKTPAGTILQIDPYFPRERPPDRFIHPRPPLHEAALRTDWVLLTHSHGDHTCVESLARLHEAYPQARYIGPAESIQLLGQAGIPAALARTVTAGDQTRADGMAVHAVWAKPPQGLPADRIPPPDVQHLGYVIDTGPVRLYVTGDLVNPFAEHEELLEPVRRLRPQIGLLTTHPTEGEFPYFEGSARMAAALGLRTAVPAHYQCFVSRTYDPREWAANLRGTEPLIIPYNQAVVYPV